MQNMSRKAERIAILKNLIKSNKVANQEDLCLLLKSKGFHTTQATLSRDLKELKVFKIADGMGGYRYSLHEMHAQEESGQDLASSFPIGVKSIEFSGQFAVIKTKPGYANMVGSNIDSRLKKELMGTIAGDDTLLLILRKGYTEDHILSVISEFIPGIAFKVVK